MWRSCSIGKRTSRSFRNQQRHARTACPTRGPAAEATDLFVYRVERELGALASTLGGLDGLVFMAGVGEHAPEIRRRMREPLGDPDRRRATIARQTIKVLRSHAVNRSSMPAWLVVSPGEEGISSW